MNLLRVVVLSIFAFLLVTAIAHADLDEYTGKLQSRPKGKAGTWVIGGKKWEATDKTELEDEYGPIRVGGCVVVEYDGKRVAFIKSEEEEKCR
jgi:hypothetical protein